MIYIEDNLYYYSCGSIKIIANDISSLAKYVLLTTGFNIYTILN